MNRRGAAIKVSFESTDNRKIPADNMSILVFMGLIRVASKNRIHDNRKNTDAKRSSLDLMNATASVWIGKKANRSAVMIARDC